MAKDNVDVSSDLSSLLGELSKIKKEEDKTKQKKVEELNNDVSFASMMAELSQVAKDTKKKKLLVEPEMKSGKTTQTTRKKLR